MAFPHDGKKWAQGKSANPSGRPKGLRNRSTIAKEVLELVARYPENIFRKLQEQYPGLRREMTIEEMMTIVQADKAIRKQDSKAYEVLMDSVYGKPKQDMNINSGGDITITVENEDQKRKIDNLRVK